MNEIWKKIKNFLDYEISNLGRIRSFKSGKERILKQDTCCDHNYIQLYGIKKRIKKYIHILVYETFNDYKLKTNECVHHLDENKRNNIISNLQKMTKLEHNRLHNTGQKNSMFGMTHSKKSKEKISKKVRGSNNGRSKLKESQVIEILQLLDKELSQRKIAEIYKISPGTVKDIKSCKIWKHIKR